MNTSAARKTIVRLVAEGLIIFAGVTASLYANEWREHQKDTRAELEALRLIADDLTRDSAQLAAVEGVFDGNVRASAWLTERWNASVVDPDSSGRAVQHYVFGAFYRPQNSAFTSLQEGAGLDLIQNDTLRAAIIRYYTVSQPQVMDMVRLHMEEVLALIDDLGPYFRLFEGPGPGKMWPPKNMPAERLSTWHRFVQDGTVYNKIAFVGALAQVGAEVVQRNLEEGSALKAAIRRTLERGG